MTTTQTLTVREPVPGVRVVEVVGDVTPAVEDPLMDAYARASAGGAAVVLDFEGLEYMNSGGIGLLVTLVVRSQRERHPFLACGLSDHYRQILELTRLDEAISIHEDETAAVDAAVSGRTS